MTAADINIGIGSLLETFEMMSVIHISLLLNLIFALGCLHSFTFARSLTSHIGQDLQIKHPVCVPLAMQWTFVRRSVRFGVDGSISYTQYAERNRRLTWEPKGPRILRKPSEGQELLQP